MRRDEDEEEYGEEEEGGGRYGEVAEERLVVSRPTMVQPDPSSGLKEENHFD